MALLDGVFPSSLLPTGKSLQRFPIHVVKIYECVIEKANMLHMCQKQERRCHTGLVREPLVKS